MKRKVYNFSPGPALLPADVMEIAQREFLDYKGSGMSILEVSHRSGVFQEVIENAEANLRQLMAIPENYEVLFLQGGASTQFAMVPLNLMKNGKAAFWDTGRWSERAIAEAEKYGNTQVLSSSRDRNYSYVPPLDLDKVSPETDYLHITTNNTIFGTRLSQIPDSKKIPLVADMSSNILSETYQVEDFGLIYAGAQKNIGPAGMTVVIIRKDLIGSAHELCPKMLNYQTHSEKNSLYNTPPTFAIYLTGLVFKWTLDMGGVSALEVQNRKKAQLLYDFIDSSSFYSANISEPDRSWMNICFKTPDGESDLKLVGFAEEKGCMFLKGHRSVGGLRASLYNSMNLEGVEYLVEVLDEFQK
ncbi:MAG: 3-phosphoserine/phosphohydroxythreonine transaminase [Bacteroidia bacterium]|nr:3-phosphoserine/phosphohydroxythreonine transaminase [Bacteroidia bacterium]